MILTIINLICFSWVVSNIPDMIDKIKNTHNIWLLIVTTFSCPKCAGLWITLLYTGDVGLASIVSLSLYIIDKLINSIPLNI